MVSFNFHALLLTVVAATVIAHPSPSKSKKTEPVSGDTSKGSNECKMLPLKENQIRTRYEFVKSGNTFTSSEPGDGVSHEESIFYSGQAY